MPILKQSNLISAVSNNFSIIFRNVNKYLHFNITVSYYKIINNKRLIFTMAKSNKEYFLNDFSRKCICMFLSVSINLQNCVHFFKWSRKVINNFCEVIYFIAMCLKFNYVKQKEKKNVYIYLEICEIAENKINTLIM